MADPETVEVPASELAAMRRELGEITQRLNVALVSIPQIPADAIAAHTARESAKLRGFFWVPEFAAVIGHHRQFVSDRCASRVIRTLKGGKPYRVPLDEESRWNTIESKN